MRLQTAREWNDKHKEHETMNARAIDIMHELEDTNTALQRARAELAAATAERARYGDMMTERLGQCENERDAAREELAIARKVMDKVADQRDAARAEAAALRGALAEMGAYINKYVTLTDTERWLLSTIEAALPSDNSSHVAQ